MDGAMAEYEKLLTLRERQIGGDPLDTAEAQVRLAGLHLRVGRIPSGRELLIRAVPVLERKGGARLAEAYEMLACAEDLSGRGKEAQHYRDKALRAAAIHAVDAVS